MKYFVKKHSIVRKIWGKADTVLFIFAAAAAEFALNKAVDWLYFTGRLPADPLGRLFSTVTYSRKILFSTEQDANMYIDQITAIHKQVEAARDAQIPDWAYRDVLFMLIDHSIRSFELLERKLTADEKDEVFGVFYRVGLRMKLKGLPTNYTSWLIMRDEHLKNDMILGAMTKDLFKQYRRHLGAARYWLLKKVQALVAPPKVKEMLFLGNGKPLKTMLVLYKISGKLGLGRFLRNALLPKKYRVQIQEIDKVLN